MEKNVWFKITISEQQSKLIRYTHRIVRNEESARDVVQDGFIKLWDQRFPESIDLVPPWLYRVCRNLAIDHYRRANKLEELSDDHIVWVVSEEEKQLGREVYQAIQSLPKKSMEVMILMFQEGLSYKEIAEVTGLSVSHVGVIIHQSIKTIRQHFNHTESNHE